MKTCCRCHLPKTESDFHRMAKMPDGLRPECKECRKPETKANQPRQNRRRRERRKTDATWRESENRRHKKYNSKANARAKKAVNTFSDYYVAKAFCRGTTLIPDDVLKYPLLIELQRATMRINRFFRNEKKEL